MKLYANNQVKKMVIQRHDSQAFHQSWLISEQSISKRVNYHHDLFLDVDVQTHQMLKSMNQK
jgi:hypothetical protein